MSGSVTSSVPVKLVSVLAAPPGPSTIAATEGSAMTGASLTLLTTTSKTLELLPPLASVTVNVTVLVPTSPLPGVPESVFVDASKLNQSADAEAFIAIVKSVSPASTSEAVITCEKAASCATELSDVVEIVGASFVFATVIVKVSVADKPVLSVKTTLSTTSPTKSLSGVPVKTPVEDENVSHDGKFGILI